MQRQGLGARLLVTGLLVSTTLSVASPSAQATAGATIGSISTGTRPGSEVGSATPTLPTLQFCVTYTTTDQARDYGYEVTDGAGVRPPFGSSYTRQFDFVPPAEWAAGARLTPKTLCNKVTLEPGRTYTVRAWVTSGPFETRGSWALTPAAAPTAASYIHVTAGSGPTATTTPPSDSGSSGSGGGGGGGATVTCPPSAPVRVTVGGSVSCVSLEIYCRANPGWSDTTRGLRCPGATGAPGAGSPAAVCNAVASTPKAGRSALRISGATALARQTVQFEVLNAKRWYVLGSTRIRKSGVAVLSTDSRVINAKKTYRIRATQGSRVVCTGSLTVPVRLNLRGTARLA